MKDASVRAAEIHRTLVSSGHAIQVRWHRGQILTYRYPAPRGYGTRGELIAIYTAGAHVEWIEADLRAFQPPASDTCRLAMAFTA